MNWALVESGMGQLQVAVADLGEGLWQGMRAGPGHLVPGTWAPGHGGTVAWWHAVHMLAIAAHKRGRNPPAVVTRYIGWLVGSGHGRLYPAG
jgi:hypothetical protein